MLAARTKTQNAVVRPQSRSISAFFSSLLEHLVLPSGSFELAYSSLALHYIVNLEGLLATVRAALVPGGRLIFSVEHPIFTAPMNPGWSVDAAGRKAWPVDGYLDEGPRSTDWLAKGVIKQHRTIGTYVSLLVGSGFSLSHIDEWGPSHEQVAARPDWADERQRPPFLLVACSRPAATEEAGGLRSVD